jgi:hypothetical protein
MFLIACDTIINIIIIEEEKKKRKRKDMHLFQIIIKDERENRICYILNIRKD